MTPTSRPIMLGTGLALLALVGVVGCAGKPERPRSAERMTHEEQTLRMEQLAAEAERLRATAWVELSVKDMWSYSGTSWLFVSHRGEATLLQLSGTERWQVEPEGLRMISRAVDAFDFPYVEKTKGSIRCGWITDASVFTVAARVGGKRYEVVHTGCMESEFACSLAALQYVINRHSGASHRSKHLFPYLPEKLCDGK